MKWRRQLALTRKLLRHSQSKIGFNMIGARASVQSAEERARSGAGAAVEAAAAVAAAADAAAAADHTRPEDPRYLTQHLLVRHKSSSLGIIGI